MLGGRAIEICGCWEEGRVRYMDPGRKGDCDVWMLGGRESEIHGPWEEG